MAPLISLIVLLAVAAPPATHQRDDAHLLLLPTSADSRPSGTGLVEEESLQSLGAPRLGLASVGERAVVNASNVFEFLLKRKPYSKHWPVEQKWDDIYKRFKAIQGTVRQMLTKSLLKDVEHYADLAVSPQCERDLRFVQSYARSSTNFRWLAHMLDSIGKSEPGMLTGNLAHLGHPIQCIKSRAPARPSNDTFDERYFDEQTKKLGERFRGKYCVASLRPVLPVKPRLVSRFSELMDESLLSNISFIGEPDEILKQRAHQVGAPDPAIHRLIDRNHLQLDRVPFESELYAYLIRQRNFMFVLPRFLGVCYPSSCSREDVRLSLQKSLDEQHQVVDIEFECEQEELDTWKWFITPRLISYVLLTLIAIITAGSSLMRHILVNRLALKKSKMAPESHLANLLSVLEMVSMDKCAGLLFVKTKQASHEVDLSKVENNRSTSIDALKGLLILMLIYSQLTLLGCLPVPFMWSKWVDAMFPFYRSLPTQIFLNVSIWSDAFYVISAYLVGIKLLENNKPTGDGQEYRTPNLVSFLTRRYVRLVVPMVAFLLLNYVWPRLSNGFVMQDQAQKLMAPCDQFGWTNFLLFHNHFQLNETCLWPSHVSASFFQLHLLSYPILVLCLMALKMQLKVLGSTEPRRHRLIGKLMTGAVFLLIAALALIGLIQPALVASEQDLIVPFLIDYIDFDNYRRVIEWTVMPTYNHLTGYMLGLALAFLVARRRTRAGLDKSASMDFWRGHYIYREGSLERAQSSSTQELRQFGRNHSAAICKLQRVSGTPIPSDPSLGSSEAGTMGPATGGDGGGLLGSLWAPLKTLLALGLMLLSLASSWYWNSLGEPMSRRQTFWFVCLTKLAFCLTFAYLFHEHFATRRNSSSPWILIRFLVPIGRMSLMAFYMSWLVIWFDLLSSLYQWHPSHYFVGEKFNEIIFLTLILSMLAYGAFEGIPKKVQYAIRASRVECAAERTGEGRRKSVKRFESFFVPKTSQVSIQGSSRPKAGDESSADDNKQVAGHHLKLQLQLTGDPSAPSKGPPARRQQLQQQVPAATGASQTPTGHLTAADRCRLNAELRANYSFASIGLYESAGATGDLSQLSPADPQVSPAPRRA